MWAEAEFDESRNRLVTTHVACRLPTPIPPMGNSKYSGVAKSRQRGIREENRSKISAFNSLFPARSKPPFLSATTTNCCTRETQFYRFGSSPQGAHRIFFQRFPKRPAVDCPQNLIRHDHPGGKPPSAVGSNWPLQPYAACPAFYRQVVTCQRVTFITVEVDGLEPTTPALQTPCSPN